MIRSRTVVLNHRKQVQLVLNPKSRAAVAAAVVWHVGEEQERLPGGLGSYCASGAPLTTAWRVEGSFAAAEQISPHFSSTKFLLHRT